MTQSLRIGIDARELAAHPTGVGRYLAELVARWTRVSWAAGHTLVLFSPTALPAEAGWRGHGGAGCVDVVVPGAGGTRWEQGALATAARASRLDVFFAPGYTAPLALSRPIVVAMHDVSFAAHPEWFRWREGRRQHLLARLSARRARRLLTLTEFSRREIVRYLSVPDSRIDVVAPAVDTHWALATAGAALETDAATAAAPGDLATAAAPADRLVLYVGTIFTRRHVPALIDAFTGVAAARPDVALLIVGADRSWPPQDVGRCIAASPVASRITWRPWLAEPALRAAYARARVFAFLSEYEGFGLTPLEALSHGVPPVVADVPVAHEAYGDAAVFVRPDDREAIAAAVMALLDEGPVRERVRESAPAVLARYSWDATARRALAIVAGAATASP
jgi:glycosyltransferase involved in cell wall biosynthesis